MSCLSTLLNYLCRLRDVVTRGGVSAGYGWLWRVSYDVWCM